MKKVLLIIITLIYVVMSSGVTLTYHYCKGRLANVKVMALADNCASCGKNSCVSCGMQMNPSPCCSDETQFIKITSDQNISNFMADLSPATIELLPVLLNEFRFLQPEDVLIDHQIFDDPPECTSTPLFIHHCTFLI